MIELFQPVNNSAVVDNRSICSLSLAILGKFCDYLRSIKESPTETFSGSTLYSEIFS